MHKDYNKHQSSFNYNNTLEMVSIIIPLYNKQISIEKTIQSVLDQTYKNFELIIVNDGSTDNSLSIVRKFNDCRIRIIDKKNEGVSTTRNRGAQEAKSNLLFFLDADDYIYSNCLEILMRLHDKYDKMDLWSANYEKKGKNTTPQIVLSNTLYGEVENPHKLRFCREWHFRIGSFLISKDSFFYIGGYPSYMTNGEDYFFQDNYCDHFRCAYTPEVVLSYIQEFRGLSRERVDYHKKAEWYLSFSKKNKWQKLNYSSHIAKSTLKAFIHLDLEEFFAMIGKYKLWVVYGIYATIMRSIISFYRK